MTHWFNKIKKNIFPALFLAGSILFVSSHFATGWGLARAGFKFLSCPVLTHPGSESRGTSQHRICLKGVASSCWTQKAWAPQQTPGIKGIPVFRPVQAFHSSYYRILSGPQTGPPILRI
jgi:hypothetical protein